MTNRVRGVHAESQGGSRLPVSNGYPLSSFQEFAFQCIELGIGHTPMILRS